MVAAVRSGRWEWDSRIPEFFSKVLAGDREAFGDLYYLTKPSLLKILSRAFRSLQWDELEDVTQEAYAALYKRRLEIRTVQAVIAYLLGIAWNRAIDVLRNKGRCEALSPEAEDRLEIDDESRLDSDEAIRTFLRRLNLKDLVLVRFRLEGATLERIAKERGCSRRSLRRRITRIGKLALTILVMDNPDRWSQLGLLGEKKRKKKEWPENTGSTTTQDEEAIRLVSDRGCAGRMNRVSPPGQRAR